jgi:hypothetical protein
MNPCRKAASFNISVATALNGRWLTKARIRNVRQSGVHESWAWVRVWVVGALLLAARVPI